MLVCIIQLFCLLFVHIVFLDHLCFLFCCIYRNFPIPRWDNTCMNSVLNKIKNKIKILSTYETSIASVMNWAIEKRLVTGRPFINPC